MYNQRVSAVEIEKQKFATAMDKIYSRVAKGI